MAATFLLPGAPCRAQPRAAAARRPAPRQPPSGGGWTLLPSRRAPWRVVSPPWGPGGGAGDRAVLRRISTGHPSIPSPPPDAVKFPRGRLDIKLAVLCMRSTYEAVDDLDFIPMDRFQIRFWKNRQAEYESYVSLYSPIRFTQGDLADPLYFDFISYAQWATISKEIPDAPQVFQESTGADGGQRTVRRAAEYADNTALPRFLEVLVGEKIYDGLVNGFQEATFGGPPPCARGAGVECAAQGMGKLLDIFVSRGYALKARVVEVDSKEAGGGGRAGVVRTRVEGPATLWGLQRLESRGNALVYGNAFHSLALAAFLRASGWRVEVSQRVSDTAIDEKWTLS